MSLRQVSCPGQQECNASAVYLALSCISSLLEADPYMLITPVCSTSVSQDQSGYVKTTSADPARAGLSKRVVEFCQTAGARRIVYVSCNPSTMARDLASLSTQFEIVSVQPVDMFPQTSHVECIAILQRCRQQREL